MKLKYVAPLLALSMAIGTAYAADTVTVTIGSASPLSGPQASFGQDNANGVKMAIKDLNAQNIVIDGKKVEWKVDAQDDQADPKQATTVAQKFVDEKVNGVVGHLNSGCTSPLRVFTTMRASPTSPRRPPIPRFRNKASRPSSASSPTTTRWAQVWPTMPRPS